VAEIPYVRQPVDFSTPVRYAYGPDSFPQPGVPGGAIHKHELSSSEAFPGTVRSYWVYVPARYDGSSPASLMVVQDGWMYLDSVAEIRAGVVLDNLIHRGEMPVTVGVFVDPGQPGNRNAEYDAFDDAYAAFLLTEILPGVQDRYRITDDPDRWAIAGGSSGGSCAFTAAWMRPDRFRRVLSLLGSFTQIDRGNPYPDLLRRTPRKPLRVFLQAATRDLGGMPRT